MSLIRVTRCQDIIDNINDGDVIINTSHIVMVNPDDHKPSRGVWVQMMNCEPILVRMNFEEIWTFLKRET
ncbi:MAG: hypothetical protein ACO1QB_00280 [Verrucomicrobiales bacterium]